MLHNKLKKKVFTLVWHTLLEILGCRMFPHLAVLWGGSTTAVIVDARVRGTHPPKLTRESKISRPPSLLQCPFLKILRNLILLFRREHFSRPIKSVKSGVVNYSFFSPLRVSELINLQMIR